MRSLNEALKIFSEPILPASRYKLYFIQTFRTISSTRQNASQQEHGSPEQQDNRRHTRRVLQDLRRLLPRLLPHCLPQVDLALRAALGDRQGAGHHVQGPAALGRPDVALHLLGAPAQYLSDPQQSDGQREQREATAEPVGQRRAADDELDRDPSLSDPRRADQLHVAVREHRQGDFELVVSRGAGQVMRALRLGFFGWAWVFWVLGAVEFKESRLRWGDAMVKSYRKFIDESEENVRKQFVC